MRRPRWVKTLAFLAGAMAIALVARLQWNSAVPVPQPTKAEPAASLGPLPLALPEDSSSPARLSGQIESAGGDLLPEGPSAEGDEVPAASLPPGEPPPLGDDPWRPSTRVASYQSESPVGGDPPRTKSALMADETSANQGPEQTTVITHRIIDGDTLSGLAQRYLGSSQRFTEIFAANRDQLQSPDLLPIGAVLRIPGKKAVIESPHSSSAQTPTR